MDILFVGITQPECIWSWQVNLAMALSIVYWALVGARLWRPEGIIDTVLALSDTATSVEMADLQMEWGEIPADTAAQSWSLKGLDAQVRILTLASQREWTVQAKAHREGVGICLVWLEVEDIFEQGTEKMKPERITTITESLQYILVCLSTYSFRSLSVSLGRSSTPDALPLSSKDTLSSKCAWERLPWGGGVRER